MRLCIVCHARLETVHVVQLHAQASAEFPWASDVESRMILWCNWLVLLICWSKLEAFASSVPDVGHFWITGIWPRPPSPIFQLKHRSSQFFDSRIRARSKRCFHRGCQTAADSLAKRSYWRPPFRLLSGWSISKNSNLCLHWKNQGYPGYPSLW